MTWLEETEKSLDAAAETDKASADKIKGKLAKHREVQRALAAKQPAHDQTQRAGKALRERAPKPDEVPLRRMCDDLKTKWNNVCTKAVDRQRKLEEALLLSGQFQDAVQALLDWLKKVEVGLAEKGPVHGDLDTVTALVEQHRVSFHYF